MVASAISYQLRKLKDRGVVQNRREGLTIYYSVIENKLDPVLQLFKEFNYLPTMEGLNSGKIHSFYHDSIFCWVLSGL